MSEKTKGLGWFIRALIYLVFCVLGWVAANSGTECIVEWLSNLYPIETEANDIINPSIPVGIFLFGFVLGIGTLTIRTFDTIQQFKDSLQVRNDTLQARNDTLVIEAVRLLFEGKEVESRVQGMFQIADLAKRGVIDKKQLGRITKSKIDLNDIDLRGVNLEDVNFWGANLKSANIRGADLTNANLEGANLHRADIRGANLKGANLRDAFLKGANLERANLRAADLGDANFMATNLKGTNLEGAKYNKNTKFSNNFSPTDAKMIMTSK